MGRSVSAMSTLSLGKCIQEAGFKIIQSENFKLKTKAAECGLCSPEEVDVEDMLYIYTRRLAASYCIHIWPHNTDSGAPIILNE